jgi:hypothetical protein
MRPLRGSWIGSLVLSLLCSPACDTAQDDTSPESDADTDADSDVDTDSDVDAGDLVGRLSVTERFRQDYDTHDGAATAWGPLDAPWEDGVVGDWIISCDEATGDIGVWRVTRTWGDCWMAVLQPCSADCEPACEPGTWCTSEGDCVAAPRFADAGTLTLGGLAVPVSLEPGASGYPDAHGLPADLFDPGDPITLNAEGGQLAAFAAEATGVEPVDAVLPCEEVPATGQDLALAWTPSDVAGARIRWDMTQDVHLSQGPRVRCETADTGSLTLPAELMDAYVHGKKHGLTLTRYTLDAVQVPGVGQVAFEVGTSVGCVVNEDHTPW